LGTRSGVKFSATSAGSRNDYATSTSCEWRICTAQVTYSFAKPSNCCALAEPDECGTLAGDVCFSNSAYSNTSNSASCGTTYD